ncbi:type II toxin-antitoxin system VapC family toxin [Curvibacter sp. CHRR-16]|uniref:type II toxin-antitoxin system VapC family toxin n=1 Tax=Curvibacter sp. CHRR-16 TaxID=2835872 RepID=UPI001BDB517A|nr:type II toxin-antitoxin system VapC family toxin [Curvibacter sp. CHRR-16]MBT0569223.1 type II toxin-antitoxin system VapC family toxin [Curvibacter sp. CHRR-16]
MIALDTNVLARYYVTSSDAPSQKQSLQAKKLLESGKRLFVSKTVVLELEWVLRGYYKSEPPEVLVVLRHLLAMPNVEVEDRLAVEMACNALEDGFDFADALHHASSRHCSSMATFDDKKFARKASAKGWKPAVKVVSA